MKKAFKELTDLLKNYESKSDTASNMTGHLAKLTEEIGELAQSVNKTNGRKKRLPEETNDKIKDNIVEEASDAIQCIMAIVINAGGDYDSLKKSLHKKNGKFAKEIDRKRKSKV